MRMLPGMLHTPVLAGDGGGAEAEGGEQQSVPRTHQLNHPLEAKIRMKTHTLEWLKIVPFSIYNIYIYGCIYGYIYIYIDIYIY